MNTTPLLEVVLGDEAKLKIDLSSPQYKNKPLFQILLDLKHQYEGYDILANGTLMIKGKKSS